MDGGRQRRAGSRDHRRHRGTGHGDGNGHIDRLHDRSRLIDNHTLLERRRGHPGCQKTGEAQKGHGLHREGTTWEIGYRSLLDGGM